MNSADDRASWPRPSASVGRLRPPVGRSRTPRSGGGKSGLALFLAVAVAATLGAAGATAAEDRVLYRYTVSPVFDGAYGPVARAQAALSAAMRRCGATTKLDAPGVFGPLTRDAVASFARCPATVLPAGSPAREGALTASAWAALLPDPPPGPDVRGRALLLSFEATDYTRAEWNFCQSRPLYDPGRPGDGVCWSNDRRSYLTWGPNGATAGHAREVQNILALVEAKDRSIVDGAFGREASAVRRMLALPEADRATETYLCGVWADPVRRAAWSAGFQALGGAPAVRAAYDRLYRSAGYDGGKIAAFERAYAARAYRPSEVDFAFFVDRAAQTEVAEAEVLAIVRPGLATWEVRREIALGLRSANPAQRRDRLGRDMAFYVDAAPAGALTSEELAAWAARGRRRASDVGLADERPAPVFSPGPSLPSAPAAGVVTRDERALCPTAVLATQPPPIGVAGDGSRGRLMIGLPPDGHPVTNGT